MGFCSVGFCSEGFGAWGFVAWGLERGVLERGFLSGCLSYNQCVSFSLFVFNNNNYKLIVFVLAYFIGVSD